MPGLLGKKFPTPVAAPMWPFYTAGLVIAYGINSVMSTMLTAEPYKSDPRNPNLKKTGGAQH